MAQNVIVYIIGGMLVLYLGYRLWRMLSGRHPEDFNPCAGCKGCEARDAFQKKRDACTREQGGEGCGHCSPPNTPKTPENLSPDDDSED